MSVNKHRDNTIIPYIIEVMCLRLREKEALNYLQDRGFKISHDFYYRLRKEVQDSTHTRLSLIANSEFLNQHIERIDMLKTIQNEMWTNYHLEKNPSKRSQILMQIAELQQYLSSYYDMTQYVMERAAVIKKRKKVEQEQEQQQ